MATWVDTIAFVYRFVCRLELCDFVPQVTHLLFKRNWMFYFFWIRSYSVSCLIFLPQLCLKVFPPFSLLKGPPSSALAQVVCTKLICPVHISSFSPSPTASFACRNLNYPSRPNTTSSIKSLLTIWDTPSSPRPRALQPPLSFLWCIAPSILLATVPCFLLIISWLSNSH